MLKSNPKGLPLPSVSVIVPFYNEEKCLSKNFESLISQQYPRSKMEIIYVNDGSTDNSLKILRRLVRKHRAKIRGLQYSIIDLKRNRGVAHARNVGIRRSKGKLVWLVDADCIADKKVLTFLVKRLVEENVDCVMGSYTLQSPEDTFLPKYRFEASKSGWTDLSTKPSPSACNNLYKKRVFNSILFNEKYVGAGLEDREFGERFLKKFRVCGESRAKAHHQLQETSIIDHFRKRIKYGRSQANYYIDKHSFLNIAGLAQMLPCFLLFLPLFLMVSDFGKVLCILWLLTNIYLFFFRLFPQAQIFILSNRRISTKLAFLIFSVAEKLTFLGGFVIGLVSTLKEWIT